MFTANVTAQGTWKWTRTQQQDESDDDSKEHENESELKLDQHDPNLQSRAMATTHTTTCADSCVQSDQHDLKTGSPFGFDRLGSEWATYLPNLTNCSDHFCESVPTTAHLTSRKLPTFEHQSVIYYCGDTACNHMPRNLKTIFSKGFTILCPIRESYGVRLRRSALTLSFCNW